MIAIFYCKLICCIWDVQVFCEVDFNSCYCKVLEEDFCCKYSMCELSHGEIKNWTVESPSVRGQE